MVEINKPKMLQIPIDSTTYDALVLKKGKRSWYTFLIEELELMKPKQEPTPEQSKDEQPIAEPSNDSKLVECEVCEQKFGADVIIESPITKKMLCPDCYDKLNPPTEEEYEESPAS